MDVTRAVTSLSSAEVQDLWFVQSSGDGWIFAADWHEPAIEALCEACVRGDNLWPAAERLGSARADAGVSLGETLADIDGLTTVLPGLPADVLHRAVSLGWADRMMAPIPTVFDPLTGLVSIDYLRTRFGEVYRAGEVADHRVSADQALVVVRLDLTGRTGWDRITPLILAGDALRTVFDGGQTLVRLADHMAVALTDRDPQLARRVQLLSGLVTDRLSTADRLPSPGPRVWIERLPDSLPAAIDLIGELGRG
jgi:hypothetical protein